MNWANDTDVELLAPTLTGFESMGCPSMSSEAVTLLTGAALRFTMPAVTVIRSWPEKLAREKATDGIDMFDTSSVATEIGVKTVDSGNRISSAPVQPVFWKSLTSTTSLFLSDDALSRLCASLSAGP